LLVSPSVATAAEVFASSGVLRFHAAADEINTLDISTSGGTYQFVDSGARLLAGNGCVRRTSHWVECVPVDRLVVELGPRDDIVQVDRDIPVEVFTGEGDDLAEGGEAQDFLNGGPGDDTLFGFERADRLQGDEGDDFLYGGNGSDLLLGFAGADVLEGRRGDADVVLGGTGPDLLVGNDGDDILDGQEGDDALVGGAGRDRLEGGLDSDDIYGRDSDVDTIICVDGADRTAVDQSDSTTGCRRAEPPPPQADTWPPTGDEPIARATATEVGGRIVKGPRGRPKSIKIRARTQERFKAVACVRTRNRRGRIVQSFRESILTKRWDPLRRRPGRRAARVQAALYSKTSPPGCQW
jgi:Ca2+-binding RTX toxin-like protein